MVSKRILTKLARAMYACGIVFILSSMLLAAVNIPVVKANGGAVWTTHVTCSDPAPQDENEYAVGDWVHVRGGNFLASTTYYWTITGNPGGSSSDPGIVVASGSVGTDVDGYFCVQAYQVLPGDDGVYTVDVYDNPDYQGGSKNDNYHVNGIIAEPALSLVKTVNPITYSAVGNILSYTYVLTNSGNVPLDGPITVTDNKVSVSCPVVVTLAVSANVTCTASHTITQADLDAGSIVNIATGHAAYGGNAVNSNPDDATATATQTRTLLLDKTVNPTTYSAVGNTLSYTYVLTNTGNVTLIGPFTVTDDKASATCPAATSLAPTAQLTCTATHVITQADLDAGLVTNTAQAHAGTVNSNFDSATATVVPAPALSLDKTANPMVYSTVGQTISYSYLLTNIGNVTLSAPYSVTDNKATVTCPSTPVTLAPLATVICSASYTITQTDLDSGSVTNTATAKAKYGGADVNSNQDSVTVNAQGIGPELTLLKSVTPGTYDSVGDVLSYSFLLTNSGEVTLSGPFTIADNKSTDEWCPVTATLAPGASITCTASYTVTQADLNNGSVTNTAQGHGSFKGAPVDSNYDSETANATQSRSLLLDKSVNTPYYEAVGNVLFYSYLLTNTSNVTLNGPFSITDDKSIDESCPVTATLAPGASITCTASYTITQADLDAGSVTNTAQGHGGGVDSNFDNATATVIPHPALVLDKTADPMVYSTVGQTITYSYKLTNSGNVTLSAPYAITDNKFSGVSCPVTPATLAPLAFVTCTKTYNITQADIDAGSIINVAFGAANYLSTPVLSPIDTVTITVQSQGPALTLDKTATEVSFNAVGNVLHYQYLLTNSGNVTLDGPFTITDDKSTDESCPATATLAPAAFITCTATYTVTQADLDAGSVLNKATGHGSFKGNPVNSNEDQVTVPAVQNPALTLDKTVNPTTYTAIGNILSYSYKLTNSGNVTLSGPFSIADDKSTDESCPVTATLAPGAFITCTATYTIVQADMDNLSVTNTATGQGSFKGSPVFSNQDQATAEARVSGPALLLDKTVAEDGFELVGDLLHYSYKLTNTGDVTLSGPFTVTDDKAVVTCPADATLAPNAFITCTATYTITAGDLAADLVTNTAQGHGSYRSNAVHSNFDSVTVYADLFVSLIGEQKFTCAQAGNQCLKFTLTVDHLNPGTKIIFSTTNIAPSAPGVVQPVQLTVNLGDEVEITADGVYEINVCFPWLGIGDGKSRVEYNVYAFAYLEGVNGAAQNGEEVARAASLLYYDPSGYKQCFPTEDLTVRAVCYEPTPNEWYMRWLVNNPNPFDIELAWQFAGENMDAGVVGAESDFELDVKDFGRYTVTVTWGLDGMETETIQMNLLDCITIPPPPPPPPPIPPTAVEPPPVEAAVLIPVTGVDLGASVLGLGFFKTLVFYLGLAFLGMGFIFHSLRSKLGK